MTKPVLYPCIIVLLVLGILQPFLDAHFAPLAQLSFEKTGIILILLSVLTLSDTLPKQLSDLRIDKITLPNEAEITFAQSSFSAEIAKADVVGAQFPTLKTQPITEEELDEVNEWLKKNDKFRTSLVGLKLDNYETLAGRDIRMAIRAFRIGFENVFRNRLEFGQGIYIPGEPIEVVLDRLDKSQPQYDHEHELARILFKIIDQADAGRLFNDGEWKQFKAHAKSVRDAYVRWLLDNKINPKNPPSFFLRAFRPSEKIPGIESVTPMQG